jgi:hypothetical protein
MVTLIQGEHRPQPRQQQARIIIHMHGSCTNTDVATPSLAAMENHSLWLQHVYSLLLCTQSSTQSRPGLPPPSWRGAAGWAVPSAAAAAQRRRLPSRRGAATASASPAAAAACGWQGAEHVIVVYVYVYVYDIGWFHSRSLPDALTCSDVLALAIPMPASAAKLLLACIRVLVHLSHS